MLLSLNDSRRPRSRSGFTLVELLVVIGMIVVLASLAFTLSTRMIAAARATECLNRLRQCGTLMTTAANENNSRIRAFKEGEGMLDFRPYFILADRLELPREPYSAHFEGMERLLFCPSAPEPEVAHENCYGLNFNDSELAGATWSTETVETEGGQSATLATLIIPTVDDPARYPLFLDSSNSDGEQIFRILNENDLVALRHRNKANAVFLDGSAQALDKSSLGKLGFENAYDTSTNPPTPVPLPKETANP